MSAQPYVCESCKIDGTFVRAGKFPEDDTSESNYGVAWHCAGCDEVSLDLCPLAAVEPTKDGCLNCGAVAGAWSVAGEACPDCGMPRAEALVFLHIDNEGDRTPENAETSFDTGLFRRGFAILDSLLQSDQTDAQLWRAKGTQYQILRLNKAAARCYRRSLSLAANPLLEIALAVALSDEKDSAGALAIYDGLVESSKDPEVLAVARANRGNLHEAADRIAEATLDYEEAISLNPEGVTHYRNYTRLFTRRKRWAEAIEIVERGLPIAEGEDRVGLLVEKARSNNELERAEAGLATSEEVLELAEDHPRGLFHRAWALGLLGRLEEAETTLERLLDVDPASKDGRKALEKIRAARAKANRPWWKVWG